MTDLLVSTGRLSLTTATVKATGHSYEIAYKRSWGKRYWSCDSGRSWHRTAKAARLAAGDQVRWLGLHHGH